MDRAESPALLARATRSLLSMPDRYAALLVAGVAAAAALAARLAWPFDGLYGQDAFAYVRYARALWPWLVRGDPLPIYLWPAGYPLLVALALPFGDPAAAGQAISILSLAVAAACTYLLCRELLPDAPGGKLVAWVAGLAVAFSGDALRAGLVDMSDALALACCAAALWALARYRRTRRGRWVSAAAVALGWATITRWVCGLLALPMFMSVLLELLTKDQGPRTKDQSNPQASSVGLWSSVFGLRGLFFHGAIAFALGAAIVVPQLLASQADPAALSRHQWLVSWDIANAWRSEFVTVDGAQRYALPVGIYYLARMAWPSLLFPPLALAAVLGALWLARRRQWPALALLSGWPLMLWLFLAGIPFQNTRFVLPALPALAALAGLGFGWAYAAIFSVSPPRHQATKKKQTWWLGVLVVKEKGASSVSSLQWWAHVILVFALIISLAGSLALGVRGYRDLVAYKNQQLALVEWTRSRLPEGGVLLTFGATLTLQYYTRYDVRELYYLTPADLDAIRRQRQPAYLLLDVGNIEAQWVGLRPWQDYHHLLEQHVLEIVGERPPYTLFRIKS
jgi:4-amino-4-deoxy-L-arabinose transferase-like glycosyltransferase